MSICGAATFLQKIKWFLVAYASLIHLGKYLIGTGFHFLGTHCGTAGIVQLAIKSLLASLSMFLTLKSSFS